jgi:hypothetical protein
MAFATIHTGCIRAMSPSTPYLIYTLLDIVIGRFWSTRMIPAKSHLTSARVSKASAAGAVNLYDKIHVQHTQVETQFLFLHNRIILVPLL